MEVKGSKHTRVEVTKLPQCDFCKQDPTVLYQEAQYDGRTRMGPWAFMCREHFTQYGIKLGLGFGQELLVAGQRREPD